MDKEQFKAYLKAVFAESSKEVTGKTTVEKERNQLIIDGKKRMFTSGIKNAMFSMPIAKINEMADQVYTPDEQSDNRKMFLDALLNKYLTEHKINDDKLSPAMKSHKKGYFSVDYNRYKDIIGEYITKEQFDAEIAKDERGKDTDYKEGNFHSRENINKIIAKLLKEKNIENNKIKEITRKVERAMIPTKEEIIDLCGGVISKEDFESIPELQVNNSLSAITIREHSDAIIDYLADNVNPELFDEIKADIEHHDIQLNKPTNEIIVPKFPNEINALRQTELTKEQEDALNYIEENITNGTEDFDSDLDSYRGKMEGAFNKDDKVMVGSVRKNNGTNIFSSEVFQNDVGQSNPNAGIIDIMNRTNPESIDKFENEKIQYSPGKIQQLCDIIDKMNEYGIISDNMVLEQGGKIYGLHKMATLNGKIETALSEGKKDELPELVRQHKEISEQYQELFNEINENFPVTEDNLAYGGNIDVCRNHIFPPSIRRQVATVSHFNGLYIVASYLKANNIKPEDYFKDPTKYINGKIKEYAEVLQHKPENYKGKSPAHMIFDMQADQLKFAPDVPAFVRLIENTAKFEKDPEIRKNNIVAYDNYEKRYSALTNYINIVSSNKSNNKLFERVMLVNEEQRGYDLMGGQHYDPIKMEITEIPPFDEMTYIKNNQIDLGEFNKKINDTIKDYYNLEKDAKKGKPVTKTQNIVAIANKLATKVIAMHPEQKDSPEYKNLLKFVQDPKTATNTLVGENLDYGEIKFADTKKINEKIATYVKNQCKKSKSFGKPIIDKDKELNNLLKNKNSEQLADFEKRINNRKKELTKDFRDGKVSEFYYKARMEQLSNKDFNSPLPPMFEADKMPSMKDYMKQHDLDDLPKDDQKLIYEQVKDKANRDKEAFFTRLYLKEKGFDTDPVYTLEETNPELKGADKIVSNEIKEVTEDDIKKAYDAKLNKEEVNVEEQKQVGEKIHVDIEEDVYEPEEVIVDDGKTKTIEKDSLGKS